MKPNASDKKSREKNKMRIPRTISFDPDTDRILVEAAESEGNLSAAVRTAIHTVYGSSAQPPFGDQSHLDRAKNYMKAKEAGMAFERHVGEMIRELRGDYDIKGGTVWESGGSACVVDYWIECDHGRWGVVCKSHVSKDRIQLALAECMIGLPRIAKGAELIVVIPYHTPESLDTQRIIETVERCRLFTIDEFRKHLETKKSASN